MAHSKSMAQQSCPTAYLVGLLEDGGDVANGEDEVGLHNKREQYNQSLSHSSEPDLPTPCQEHGEIMMQETNKCSVS